MNGAEVRRLEDVCAAALERALRDELPWKLDRRVYDLMAKAAIAVVEAVSREESR